MLCLILDVCLDSPPDCDPRGGGGPLSSPAHPSHQHSPRGTIISVLHDPAVIVYLCREENRVKRKKIPK